MFQQVTILIHLCSFFTILYNLRKCAIFSFRSSLILIFLYFLKYSNVHVYKISSRIDIKDLVGLIIVPKFIFLFKNYQLKLYIKENYWKKQNPLFSNNIFTSSYHISNLLFFFLALINFSFDFCVSSSIILKILITSSSSYS